MLLNLERNSLVYFRFHRIAADSGVDSDDAATASAAVPDLATTAKFKHDAADFLQLSPRSCSPRRSQLQRKLPSAKSRERHIREY